VLSYALRDLVRNPRRTLASLTGVALAVALFASITFFVDSSAARMTERAIAPVAIDMQAALAAPLASPLGLTETVGGGSALAAGQTVTVNLTAVNGSPRTMTAVVVRDELPQQLAYVPGSATVDGRPLPDVGGESPLTAGLRVADLAAGGKVTVTYQARAVAAVASPQALGLHGTVSSKEEPAPSAANSQPPLSLAQLAQLVTRLPGVSTADQLGSLDLPAGSLRTGATAVAQPLRVFAFDPVYLQHYPMVRLTSGSYGAGTVLLSPDAARALGAGPGGTVALTVPSRAQALSLNVGGIADFSKADPLFASRSADNQGEFVQVPNVIVVPMSVLETEILPALRVDAASASPILKAPPALELDLHIDRARLATDPTVAAVTTQGLKRSLERLAPGQVSVIDNLSDALNAARGDTILAKILFLFLGLPGILLAAYLSRYAGGLLAQAQRREQATLRARGAQPRHLLRGLTYTSVCVAILGSALGLALGLLTVVLVLGPAALATASLQSFALSAGLSLLAGLVTTALALYLPGRRALSKETGDERRELEVSAPPVWLRMRLDLVFLAAAALVWIVTQVSGGFKPTAAEGQSVSLSFYTLLSPLLGWIGATLLAVRLALMAGNRLGRRRRTGFGSLTLGTLGRSVERRSASLASGVIAVALAVAFGSSLALFVATYDAGKAADARLVTGSDLRVTPSALNAQTPAFGTQLRVPGVTGVTPVAQTSNALVGTDKRALVAIDASTFAGVASLPDTFFPNMSAAAAMAALQKDPAAVLLSTEMARTFNVQPGDQVKIQLTDASGKAVPVTFHAAGLFQNFAGFPQGIDMVSNLAYYQTATRIPQVAMFFVRTADPSPAGVTRVADLLKAGPGQTTPILVETTVTAVNRDSSTLAALNLRGLGGLEAIYTVLMSAAGIAIFVFGLLLQRRKEYVTMRALGIRMGQLRSLVLGEAAVVALLSLVVGAVVGAAMAVMFVQILTPLFTIPPAALAVPAGELALFATLVLGGMGISVLLAARSLRRLNPVELLREE
jgi:putative ABC transport system permease protein